MSLKGKMNNLYCFYDSLLAHKNNPYYPPRHMRELCSELMSITLGEYRNLCVSLPPRHLKSSIITEAFPLWRILRNPNENILIITNSGSLSEKFGIRLREYIREYGSYFNVHLSDVKHSNSYLMFCDNDGELYRGSIRIVGAGGSITGTDASLIICDDVYKGLSDEFTPTALQKKIDWFNDVVLQRQEPETQLIVLHTRYHSHDLIGYLTSNFPEDYKYINYPAINHDHTVLWPERYTYKELDKKRRQMGERTFNSIYQGVPLDLTSNFFHLDKVNFGLPDDYNPGKTVRCWDLAVTEDNGDYTVGVKAVRSNNDLVIIDMVRGQYGSSNTEHIRDTTIKDGVYTQQFIEFGTSMTSKQLLPFYKDLLKGYTVDSLIPLKSKEDRATPLQGKIYDGEVYLAIEHGLEDIINEFNSFPLSEHDDIVDAVSYCCNKLFVNEEKASARLGVIQI